MNSYHIDITKMRVSKQHINCLLPDIKIYNFKPTIIHTILIFGVCGTLSMEFKWKYPCGHDVVANINSNT